MIFTPQPIEFMSSPFEDPYASGVPAETQKRTFPPEYLPLVARFMRRCLGLKTYSRDLHHSLMYIRPQTGPATFGTIYSTGN